VALSKTAVAVWGYHSVAKQLKLFRVCMLASRRCVMHGRLRCVVPCLLFVWAVAVRGVLNGKSERLEGVAVEKVVKESLSYVITFLEDRHTRYADLRVRVECVPPAAVLVVLRGDAVTKELTLWFLCGPCPVVLQARVAAYSAQQARTPRHHLRTSRLDEDAVEPPTRDEMMLLEALDTALMKAYTIGRRGTKLDAFVAAANFIHLDDAKAFFTRTQLFHVLALLFKSRGMSREALQCWKDIGSDDPTFHEAGQDGFEESVEYLATIDSPDLVWTFSPWLLRKNWRAALKIFTAGEYDAGRAGVGRMMVAVARALSVSGFTRWCCRAGIRNIPLPADRVLEHLQKFEALPISEMCQLYLEFLINVQHTEVGARTDYPWVSFRVVWRDTVVSPSVWWWGEKPNAG